MKFTLNKPIYISAIIIAIAGIVVLFVVTGDNPQTLRGKVQGTGLDRIDGKARSNWLGTAPDPNSELRVAANHRDLTRAAQIDCTEFRKAVARWELSHCQILPTTGSAAGDALFFFISKPTENDIRELLSSIPTETLTELGLTGMMKSDISHLTAVFPELFDYKGKPGKLLSVTLSGASVPWERPGLVAPNKAQKNSALDPQVRVRESYCEDFKTVNDPDGNVTSYAANDPASFHRNYDEKSGAERYPGFFKTVDLPPK